MKKINAFLVLLICLAISNQLFSQKTLTESFDYSSGSLIGQGTATNGWAGPWAEGASPSNGGLLSVIDGNYGNDTGKTGVLKQDPDYSGTNTQVRVTRDFHSDYYFVDNVPGQEVWISFYFKNEIHSELNSQSYLQLQDHLNNFSLPPIGTLSKTTTTPGTLGLNQSPGIAGSSEADLTHILVKLVLDGAGVSNGDNAYMWLNYTGSSAPDISTAQRMRTFTLGNSTTTGKITQLRLFTFKNRTAYFDKIRISNTFASDVTTGISNIESSRHIFKSGVNQLTVDLNSLKGESKLEVFDMMGRQLVQKQVTLNGKTDVNVEMATGIYIVKITNADNTITSKIQF